MSPIHPLANLPETFVNQGFNQVSSEQIQQYNKTYSKGSFEEMVVSHLNHAIARKEAQGKKLSEEEILERVKRVEALLKNQPQLLREIHRPLKPLSYVVHSILFIPKLIVSLVIDFFAGMFYMAMHFAYDNESWTKIEKIDPNKPTFVLVPGKASNPSIFALVLKICKLMNRDVNIVYVALEDKRRFSNSPNATIKGYADKLRLKLLEVQQKHNCKIKAVIAHSLGGIVAMQAAIDLHNDPTTKQYMPERLALAGSPIYGAWVAPYQPGNEKTQRPFLASQLRPESQALKKIREEFKPLVNGHSLELHLYGSSLDPMAPPSSCTYPGAKKKYNLPFSNHVTVALRAALSEIFSYTSTASSENSDVATGS